MFDEMPNRTVTSWNSIITGYFQNQQPLEAQRLFDQMNERNIVSWNGLISGYVKNRMVKEARKVFDKMPQRNVISWTAMVRGYVEEGLVEEAEALFWRMPEKNLVSWTVMLGGLIQERRIDEAKRLYDMMPVKDVVVRTNMICGYCQEGRLDEARELFDEMPRKNVVSWTAMVSGYAQNGKLDIARKLFEVMPEKNEISWTAIVISYVQYGRFEEAWKLFELMPVRTTPACNAIIFGVGQNGEVAKARMVFDCLTEKDDATWSAMIKVYERKGYELEALNLFHRMQVEGFRPNFPSLISILSICASLASLNYGREVHAQLIRTDCDDDVYVSSVLITMYIKCGDFVNAKLIFNRFSPKDVVMWNSIITGYAQHGLGDKALEVFREMCSFGIIPDEVTFVGVLSACSYTGKVKEGQDIFESMNSKYRMEPGTAHYACMVDMLGRVGRLNEAMDLINKMTVEADAIIWGSLMGACRMHMNLDMAEIAAKKLIQLEPQNSGPYVLLSNIYASNGKWADVASLRKSMQSREVVKTPGCSWLEADKKVHMFTGGQSTPHPEHDSIIKMLEKLGPMLREAGYIPDGSFALHDVEEEEKLHSLNYHSEKLAVAYGLLKLPEGVPIRVMKNLRTLISQAITTIGYKEESLWSPQIKRLIQDHLTSGTLSYIFNNFTGTKAFSQVVKEAKEAGYTEPDPRDDLSGTDVARKILTDIGFKCFRSLLSSVNLTEDLLFLCVIILARESSLDLELSDIPVQSLVPEPLRATVFADDFLHDLPKFDEELSKQRQVAEDEGEVLRYVGVVDVVNGKGLLN
ncbi:Pentatricopeptide repeat-containing protein [Capsicum annuum]|nr:Pentatricopeptide repeat-containing protein [Capsicum annuum]